jgi:PKHD-type hydroxylase
MIGKFPLLLPLQCEAALAELRNANWTDGFVPPDEYEAKIRRNHEIVMGDGSNGEDIDRRMHGIIDAFTSCQYLTTRTLPKSIGKPLFNLYTAGDEYKRHADAAFVGQNPELRTDYAVTLFLSDPTTYEGGELVLQFPSGETMSLKEPQGTMVFYPAGLMHLVTPIISGDRFAFVAWIESHVQDTQKRDILVEVGTACDELAEKEYLSDTHVRMMNVKHNLYRQWMKQA